MPLTKKQNNEIREHLEKAANPVFFFDNDQDGLCSYLLLRRYLGRGKGVPVKTSPMGEEYFRRVNEFNADYIFILDQPEVSSEFFEKAREVNLPIVWIDHHELEKSKIPDFVNYYNPLLNRKKTNEPVTALCYEISGKKEHWLGVVGSVADKFFPGFYKKFLKDYSDLGIKSKDPFDIFYNSEIGKISRMVGAGLKDRTTNVMAMIHFLIRVKNPYEILDKTKDNRIFHERFEKMDEKYKSLIEKAKSEVGESKVLFFKYSGETSMSADLANRLSYEFQDKFIFVAFIKGSRVNISTRGKKIRKKLLEIMSLFPKVTGGGHEDAVGLQMNLDDLDDFRKKVEEIFG